MLPKPKTNSEKSHSLKSYSPFFLISTLICLELQQIRGTLINIQCPKIQNSLLIGQNCQKHHDMFRHFS